MRAFVMAAGEGTRLRPLTWSLPKPLVPIGNRPVIAYCLENLARHGFREVVVNLHAAAEVVRREVLREAPRGMRIFFSYEKRLLGTAGGVKKMESFLRGETFLITSGDGLLDLDFSAAVQYHKKVRALATLITHRADDQFEYGVVVSSRSGRIQKFVEKPRWSEVLSPLVNSGSYVCEPEVLKKIPRGFYDFGSQLWPKLLSTRRLYGFEAPGYWTDVGNPKEYRRAHEDALAGRVRLKARGRRLGKALVDERAKIGRGVKLEGFCAVGARAEIGAGARLSQTIVWADAFVGPRARLHNCVVTKGARVPAGTVADSAHFLAKSQTGRMG